jgi:glycosyltransferase involved in cell wall biosynthesis
MNRYLLYADLDQRLVDGSVIWLLNFARVLSSQMESSRLYVFFKYCRAGDMDNADPRRHLNLLSNSVEDELSKIPNVTTILPTDLECIAALDADRVDHRILVDAIDEIEACHGELTRLFVRGFHACQSLLEAPNYGERVVMYWAYDESFNYKSSDPVIRLARSKQTEILTQSWAGKRYLEVFGQLSAHRIHVVPPIVDESFRQEAQSSSEKSFDRSVCYFGKIDREYGIDSLLALSRDSDLPVTIFEGKLMQSKIDKGFVARYAESVDQIDNLTVHRGIPHNQMAKHLARYSFAYCLRSSLYDATSEISTKLLEACSLGIPPLLSKCKLNDSVFGEDYPLLFEANSEQLTEDIWSRLANMSEERYREISHKCREIAKGFHGNLLSSLNRIQLNEKVEQPLSRKTMVLASHDLKFLDKVIPVLRERGLSINNDRWISTEAPEVSREGYVAAGDTIFCEWCCKQAVWFSNNKAQGQKLIIRLHRFEMFGKHLDQVNWEAVDRLIVVNHQFKRDLVDRFRLPPEKVIVFPQYICTEELNREKYCHSDYCVGMVGINPFFHKRFDRAVEILEELRELDPRYRLRVRSVMPWQIDWLWKSRPDERDRYLELFDRITEKRLWQYITFDDPGSDMEEWYRNVDIILSCSESEGCHTALMEGMSSGAFPVIFDWSGARDMFPEANIVSSIKDAVALLESGYVPMQGDRPESRSAVRDYDFVRFVDLVERLILEH